MDKYIKLINTGESIKNEFYICFFIADFSIEKINNRIINKDKIYSIIDILITDIPNGVNFNDKVNFRNIELLKDYENSSGPHFIATSYLNLLTEFYFEKIRLDEYNECPKRLTSHYAFDNLKELKYTVNFYKWNPIKIFKVKVDTTKPFLVSKHNMEYVSAIRSNIENVPIFFIQSYWQGKAANINYDYSFPNPKTYIPIYEFLIDGFITLLEEVSLEDVVEHQDNLY